MQNISMQGKVLHTHSNLRLFIYTVSNVPLNILNNTQIEQGESVSISGAFIAGNIWAFNISRTDSGKGIAF